MQVEGLTKLQKAAQTAARIVTFHFCKHKDKQSACNYNLQAT
jgi:hypothetical protein